MRSRRISPTNRETLESCLAAHTSAQSSTSSSTVMVKFFMDPILVVREKRGNAFGPKTRRVPYRATRTSPSRSMSPMAPGPRTGRRQPDCGL